MSEQSSTGKDPAQELWVPGMPLTAEFTVPTTDEFRQHFADAVWPGSEQVVTLDDSLAALRRPEYVDGSTVTPTGYAFVDVDDLLGSLGTALRRVQYSAEHDEVYQRRSFHDYGEGMWFDDSDVATKNPLMLLVKNSLLGLQADPDIERIHHTIEGWRRAGVYVTFITSAIEGTELSVVNFIGKHFPKNCDGIVITRGHYQLADKGFAALEVIKFGGIQEGMPVVHLDDLHFNTTKVRNALRIHPLDLDFASFQPVFASHFPLDPDSQHADTIAGTFDLATEHFERAFGKAIGVRPTVAELARYAAGLSAPGVQPSIS